MRKTELLIPVGNKECLEAAIYNGADAVYLGGKKFGARAYSNNFNDEEMIQAIKFCHLYGVKIYVTVNTMIFNDEIDEIIKYIAFLYDSGVDAVIVQDIGLISLIRKYFPELDIHVSTQAHNHNKPGIAFYKSLGVKRVVFDRESSLESIINIDVEIEREIFVYGALCVCYSGNCLFSALNGGRSANRGMCVGSCRLPYKVLKDGKLSESKYYLSTKDLNTMNYLNKILDNNIESLKVEGRMKSKEYVAVVTRTYRKLIDNYYNGKEMVLTEKEKEDLLKTYNRGFTEGYLFNAKSIMNPNTSNHQGISIGKVIEVNNKRIGILLNKNIHQEDAIRFEASNTGMYVNSLYDKKGLLVSEVLAGNVCYLDNKERVSRNILLGSNVLKTIDFLLNKELSKEVNRKVNVDISFKGLVNNMMEISISDGENTVSLNGGMVSNAISAPVKEEKIKEQLSKLGNTPFILNSIKIDISDNIFINLKDLNELRRYAVNNLIDLRTNTTKKYYDLSNVSKGISSGSNGKKIAILCRTMEQVSIALRNNIDIIYVTDYELYLKFKINKQVYLRLSRVLDKHVEFNNERLLCTEFGSIVKYGKENKIRSDYYLNVANDLTLQRFRELGVEGSTLSVELSINQLNNIKDRENAEILVYGLPECMIIKNDILGTKDSLCYLVNDNGDKFPVIFDGEFTHIFNKKKIDLIDECKYLHGFGYYRVELFDEDVLETQKIINRLKSL